MAVRIEHADKQVSVVSPDPLDARCLYVVMVRYRTIRAPGVSVQLRGPRGGCRSTKWMSLDEFTAAATEALNTGFAALGKPEQNQMHITAHGDKVSFLFVGPLGGIHGRANMSRDDFINAALTVALPPHAIPIMANDLTPEEAYHASDTPAHAV